ncbi:HEXXH motif-containing putative peptide modification protein [Streptomyces sp. NPDC127106]|uniref:aKG-HExxH-type peptide beta-hydroxylase n=1 Tax=Streptomyces sp. NPDC127106 TaxID=3345360 RepID=UPI003645AC4A
MRVEPGAAEAAGDEERLSDLVAGALSAAGCDPAQWRREDLRYPGVHAVAHRLRREQSPPAGRQRCRDELDQWVLRARHSAARASATALRTGWPVDLAPGGESHLAESLRRAVRQIPEPGPGGAAVTVAVADWDPAGRQVFDGTCRVLRDAWPEMAGELAVTLRQIALLSGWGVNGFTDFTVHGTAFVNAARLTGGEDEEHLPGRFRLAEALVHEGAHNRCDAAAATTPFLKPAGPRALLETPLRSDPRPLAGLFQQVLVLARSVLLYRRLPDTAAVRARHDVLLDLGRRGAATLSGHTEALTGAGRTLLDQGRAVFAAEGPRAARAAR